MPGDRGAEPTLRGDKRGVVELPFKLVIASIIVIITISIAYAGLENLSESSMRDKAETSVSTVIAAAGDVSTMGVNSSVKVKVDLTSSFFHRIDTFIIGCGAEGNDYKCKGIEYNILGDKSKWVVAKDHAGHDIVLKGKNKKVVLGEGPHEILLLKCLDHIEVSRV